MKLKKFLNEAKKPLEPIFDVNDAPKFANDLKNQIKAPYMDVQVSTLGGPENVSVILRLSLDPQDQWLNGILQNSRYSMFHFGRDAKIEQFSKSHTISKKFRKATAKNTKDAIAKVNKYLSQVK